MVTPAPVPLVEAFPAPPRLVARAYAKLQVLLTGTEEHIRELGPPELLERPWDPNRCGPATRRQLWDWLDEVAAWVNHEYGWGVDRLIPPCWPAHPPIAHELAVLADQRYTAGQAFHGGGLEEWHRYGLPLFLERMTTRLGPRCVTRHDEWPAASRYHAFTSPPATSECADRFDADAAAITAALATANGHNMAAAVPRHLALVDQDTGEILDDGHQP
jgi:hypothetical protein